MKFQRLSSLLLSGCLSVSGFGCAAFQATLEPPRPISDSRDTSAQRLVAIARIFENQGKYERAETMYRRALRHRPTDTVVRDRIDHLVARRHGQQFSAGPSTTAIAAADAVSGSRTRTFSSSCGIQSADGQRDSDEQSSGSQPDADENRRADRNNAG
jgi:Tfp pilus assembly protein PilF